jgi:hypothetical protein
MLTTCSDGWLRCVPPNRRSPDILFALAVLPSLLKFRRDKPLSPASGFPVSWSQQVVQEMSG